jgi:hypothetical protein
VNSCYRSRERVNVDGVTKRIAGAYDPLQNILHLWFPRAVRLLDGESVSVFFDEVVRDWIALCPTKPYLLVNYANLHIAANLADEYARSIAGFQAMLLGTFRYDVAPNFTGVTVALGNLKLAAGANMFSDEAGAREAIRLKAARLARGRLY